MNSRLQNLIHANVFERGYLRGKPEAEIRQQVLKALEELGEVARHVFDGKPVPFEELADVVIPMFNIAAIQDQSGILEGDLVDVSLRKSSGDVGRGRRDG
jgi:NTP pyrophosphatase (non-canonical NTP hydrolase)